MELSSLRPPPPPSLSSGHYRYKSAVNVTGHIERQGSRTFIFYMMHIFQFIVTNRLTRISSHVTKIIPAFSTFIFFFFLQQKSAT